MTYVKDNPYRSYKRKFSIIANFDLQTPGMLFPALSLLSLAYTNRFLGLAAVIRKLYDDLRKDNDRSDFYMSQIDSLSLRVEVIVKAQVYGILSLLLCVVSMVFIFVSKNASLLFFFLALAALFVSLIYIIKELNTSQNALQYIIDDCAKILKIKRTIKSCGIYNRKPY